MVIIVVKLMIGVFGDLVDCNKILYDVISGGRKGNL